MYLRGIVLQVLELIFVAQDIVQRQTSGWINCRELPDRIIDY